MPTFSTIKGFSFAVFLLFLACFSHRDLGQVSCLPESVDFTHLFFSCSTLNRETVMMFVEPGLADLTSLLPCFEIEDSWLTLAAFTVCVAEVAGVVSWEEKTVGKSEGAKIDWLEELASFDWKLLNPVVWVTGCMFKRTVGYCALSSKSSNKVYPIGIHNL